MRKNTKRFFQKNQILLAITLLSVVCFSASHDSENKPEKLQIAAIDTIVEDEINQQNLPGAVVAVIKNG